MASKLTVLVVGSTGMLGSKIISALLEKGATQFKAMVRPGSDSKEENRQKIEKMKAQGAIIVAGDLWSVTLRLDEMLASGSQDKTINFWEVKTVKCLKKLRVPRPYEGMNITHVTGLTQATTATLKALGAVEV